MKEIFEDIYIGNDIYQTLKKISSDFDKILIFSNETLANLYFEDFKNFFKDEKNKFFYFTIKDGEKYKSIEYILPVYDFMIENNFTRKSLIVSFGGGVICDVGGFIAATYMRGIDFVQIPTSLLAQIDASIGGKVAINHQKCKNMIGCFKNPYKVLIDSSFLKTLSEKNYKSGLGEMIKYSFLTKENYFTEYLEENIISLKNRNKKVLENLIEKSIKIKKYYVDIDPLEKAERIFLNFGHTYAHAIENFYNYEGISHGEAVAKGIIFDLELSFRKNLIEKSFLDKFKNIFNLLEIDDSLIYQDTKILKNLMKYDKKNSFDKIFTIGIDREKNLYKLEIEDEDLEDILSKYKNNFLKASIDIGTNSCRLLIAEIKDNNFINRILENKVEIVKLGENVNKNKFLLEEAIERTIACLKNYRNIIDKYNISDENIICFATSATRDSSNRNYFIEKTFAEAKIKINCIAGEKEAFINFKGVCSAFKNNSKDILVIDIGGGSTEFTLGNKNEIKFIKSLDIGSVRISEKFFAEGYSREKIENATMWIKNNLNLIENLKNFSFKIIGVAGTITTQISVREKMQEYNSEKIHLSKLTKEELDKNINLYLDKIVKNQKIIGLDEKRKDVIIGGSLILKNILEFFDSNEITISEYDNLVGAILGGLDE